MAIKLWLDYAIRAMNPARKEVNQNMMEQTSLIETLIKSAIMPYGIKADLMVIGSIAAQTHIESNCCVDILVLLQPFNEKTKVNDHIIIEQLIHLKCLVQNQIISKFPETIFSDTQPLSLHFINQNKPFNFSLFFGYGKNKNESESGIYTASEKIKILNIRNRELSIIDPFQNILQLSYKDKLVNQNVMPLIRILKTIKNNAINPICLTGHEISSIVYSMENCLLEKPNGQLLFLLLECSLFLKHLEENPFLRINLKSPDNEEILNQDNELRIQKGIHFLKIELDLLIRNLVLEIDLYTNIYEHTTKV